MMADQRPTVEGELSVRFESVELYLQVESRRVSFNAAASAFVEAVMAYNAANVKLKEAEAAMMRAHKNLFGTTGFEVPETGGAGQAQEGSQAAELGRDSQQGTAEGAPRHSRHAGRLE